jgi:hypothetical protein
MKPTNLQSGWTNLGVIGVMLAAVLGFYGFGLLVNIFHIKMSVPWALVSVFLLPLGFCVQLLLKLWELKEQDNLSRDEHRRLKPMIEAKTRQFLIAIIYYVFSAAILATLFFFSESDVELFKFVIKLAGALLFISVFSVYLIFLEMKAISDFKANLKERIELEKRQKVALKRLCSKE